MNARIYLLLPLLSLSLPVLGEGHGAPHNPRPAMYNRGQIYCGGHLGFALPTNIGRQGDQIGFHDVAKVGFCGSVEGFWLMIPHLGLGVEVGYKGYPGSDAGTWANLTRYGTFEAKYRALDAQVTARAFFTKALCRPFLGVRAGVELTKNSVDFQPDPNHPSFQAMSYAVSGTSPAFGFGTGVFIRAGKRALASIQANINIVPSIKEGAITVQDDVTYDEQTTYYNVHGAQTNFSVTVGFQYGVGPAKNY